MRRSSAFVLLIATVSAALAPIVVAASPSFVTTGSMAGARFAHTATLLPNGKILIAGGYNGTAFLTSAELYDPAHGTFSATGSLTTARYTHTATLLPNGKVLIAGGYGNAGYLPSAELYDPSTGTFTATSGNLGIARNLHTATLLQDGKVLITGGSNGASLSSAELYDPIAGTFSATSGLLTAARAYHTATLLPNGKVLLAGGVDAGVYLASAELYDPAARTFSATSGSPAAARANHTATLLPNGAVLIAGGYNGSSYLSSAELYDSTGGGFTSTNGSLNSSRYFHSATLLANGKVLITGGYNGGYLTSAELYDPAAATFSTTASSLIAARDYHSATLLPGGRVILAGGFNSTAAALSAAESYDPAIGTFTATVNPMTTQRRSPTMTLLPNGKVLVAGGEAVTGSVALASAELYDPDAHTFTATSGSMTAARVFHTATLLVNGKVLITGGRVSDVGAELSSAELYDPVSDSFTPTTSAMSAARAFHAATLLPNGSVLITGGSSANALSSAELYDPASGTFSTTGSMTSPRLSHTATLLTNGMVLVAGGDNTTAYPGVDLSSAELYDAASGTFSATAGPLATARQGHTATLLANGKVLIAGGRDAASSPAYLASAELYDPLNSTFTVTGSMVAARSVHRAMLLPNNTVLVAGGGNGVTVLSSAEIYDPASGSFSSTGGLLTARQVAAAALLANGQVLIAGGNDASDLAISSAELFTYDNFVQSRRPSISSVSSTSISFSVPFTVTGNFRGDSESSSGATSSSSPTNYPLVSLVSVESGQSVWLVPDSLCSLAATCNFSDNSMTLTISNLPRTLDPGWQRLTVTTNGIPSVSAMIGLACGPPVITVPPANVTAAIGATATFTVQAQGGRSYQWRQNGIAIPGATAQSYTTAAIDASYSGSLFDVVIGGDCGNITSDAATLTIADSTAPTVSVIAPSAGDQWYLSAASGPPNTQSVKWSMSDNVEICSVVVALLYSDDGGTVYSPASSGGGLPATFGSGGSCRYPGVLTTNMTYSVPSAFPSGRSSSLYEIQLTVTDQAGNASVVRSNPFFFVQSDPQVKTLILSNVDRMVAREGISQSSAALLRSKLQDLANHSAVHGRVIDLGANSSLTSLYAAWDADTSSSDSANAVLFGSGGIHDYLVNTLLVAYPSVKYIVLAGDDRIIPMARIQDTTYLFSEINYPAGGDITAGGSTVGQALAAGKYLSDDPMAMISAVSSAQLNGTLFLPDLSIGRLVETPQEMIITISAFIGQNGLLDLTLLDPASGHKVLITGYDFLSNPAAQMRTRWKKALGVSTPTTSLSPVDGSLIGGNWGLSSPATRAAALRTHLAGNGGAHYGIVGIAGHATHYEEGVPGTSPLDIQGLSTADLYGPDVCSDPSLGAVDLSGSMVYSLGCHGGLSVPGSCRSDADHSLDLPQTMLSRGVVAYIANSGYGWSLVYGVGYGGRLVQIFTEQLTAAATPSAGDLVRTSKLKYFMEDPRPDPYDQKTLMQWTLYGLPMYAIRTGIPGAVSSKRSSDGGTNPQLHLPVANAGPVRVSRSLVSPAPLSRWFATESNPPNLTQLTLSFDFTGPNVYVKHDSSGNALPNGPGCSDANGCYYTLNGLVDRGTGTTDYPIQPYLIYDSRLSGTSQHGVLWKGGTYDEESNWTPVFAQLVSNGGDGSNHGTAPRHMMIRPHSNRVVQGVDSPLCRPTDLEVNSLTLAAGEAVKNQDGDPVYSIARRYRTIDLEVFYFNDQTTPLNNCDRSGPVLGSGPYSGDYHQVSGSTISWAVPASDPAGVWRVLVVYNPNVTLNGRGSWIPLELSNDGSGTFRGSVTVTGTTRLTYVLQAVDNSGNITWLDYVAVQPPASGVPLAAPNPVDAAVALSLDAPNGVLATAASTTSVQVGWNAVAGATAYDIYRSSAGTNYVKIGSSGVTGFTDGAASPNTAYLYAIKATNNSVVSASSAPILVTTILFTDAITARVTRIKAVHVSELRTAVNAVRALAGLSSYNFTDANLTGLRIRVVHIAELRSALDSARTVLGLPVLNYIDATLTPAVTPVKAAHITALRSGT